MTPWCWARLALGGKMHPVQIASDIFGNAIGNSIVDGMAPRTRSSVSGLSGLDRDIEQDIADTRARNDAELLGMTAPDIRPESRE
jgi:hypothetical protein